ncbi:uncharacterized protein BDV17DRAFT_23419 [Aspergillus undulatus]|uniref:uncharacterized protein n=1 Tax=Aspergillus undulatus TaxID=1810928 RepID=UPI003CCDA5CB
MLMQSGERWILGYGALSTPGLSQPDLSMMHPQVRPASPDKNHWNTRKGLRSQQQHDAA